MHVRVVRHGDQETFMRRARAWLIQTEAENTLVLGIAGRATADASTYFATIEQDGAVVGCAVRTPPRKLVVTRMPPSTATPLAFDVAACFEDLPGVVGPHVAAREFASVWCARHGLQSRDTMQQRIYRLQRVIPPGSSPPGELRLATSQEAGLIASWVECFVREAGVEMKEVRSRVDQLIASREMALWHDDIPRSLAGCSGRSPHGLRIGYVYTPPEWRGRGYASACVAGFTQYSLDNGAEFCCLYTDLSNPTSNAIYQKLGYEPVAESVDIEFATPAPTAPPGNG